MNTLQDFFGLVTTPSQHIGVEVEVEVNKALPKYGHSNLDGTITRPPPTWKAVADGSLRGHSMEYVSQPIHYEDLLNTTLPLLVEHLKDYSVYHQSLRVSTHVHVNVSDMTYVQSINFACLWWSLENFLVGWCGPSRVGNNFCLRGKDATRIFNNMIKDIHNCYSRVRVNGHYSPFVNSFSVSDSKYSALNLSRVGEIGTFEFRSFPGLDFNNTSKFSLFVQQIIHLKKLAMDIDNPQDICDMMSTLTPAQFTEKFLLPSLFLSWNSCAQKNEREEMILEQEKFISAVAYCVSNWSKFEKKQPKKKNKKTIVDDLFVTTTQNWMSTGAIGQAFISLDDSE